MVVRPLVLLITKLSRPEALHKYQSVNAINMRINWQCSTHVKCTTLAVQRPHDVAGADRLAAAQFHNSADVLLKSKKEQVSKELRDCLWYYPPHLRA